MANFVLAGVAFVVTQPRNHPPQNRPRLSIWRMRIRANQRLIIIVGGAEAVPQSGEIPCDLSHRFLTFKQSIIQKTCLLI